MAKYNPEKVKAETDKATLSELRQLHNNIGQTINEKIEQREKELDNEKDELQKAKKLINGNA